MHARFVADKLAQGCSPDTIDYHRACWARFKKFWNGEDEIDRFLLRDYLAHPRLTCNRTSVNTKWRSLKTFFRWYFAEELVPIDLAAKITPPRQEFVKKEPLTDD